MTSSEEESGLEIDSIQAIALYVIKQKTDSFEYTYLGIAVETKDD